MECFRQFNQIEVKLIGAIQTPYETAVASARTCYSGRGIILPEEISKDEKAIALRDRIAASTMEAGHLTTRQHAHFVFAISGVSRHFIWNFLHSHPFYNSEQVSQRYVRIKRGAFLMPPLPPEATDIFSRTADLQMSAYEKLIDLLRVPLSEDFYDRFKARKKQPEKWQGSIDKRAFEVARYALGVGTTSYLYHTISALTLLRYARLQHHFDTPQEQKIVIEQMLQKVCEIDPLFTKELQDPLPLDQSPEFALLQENRSIGSNARFIAEFDQQLEGKISKLANCTPNAEKMLAQSVRIALGKSHSEIGDEAALALLIDPAQNRILGENLNSSVMDRLSQNLHHVHFTFLKKISHTADSQDQRHRTVMASRPILQLHYTGKPDYITPFGVTQSPEALELYQKTMEASYNAINQLLDLGVTTESAYYLLPNAASIRMVSSGDLHSHLHKWKLRSCYNAQEEIFRATVEEIQQVANLYPKLAEHIKAPCYLRQRAGIKPYCPEGDRFCGLPVWKYDLSQYQRKSL